MAKRRTTNEICRDDEILRLERADRDGYELTKLSRNLNLLALQGNLAPVFHRDAEVEAIQKLLLRRTKPNALLVGPAGCGKTAIAEALAIFIANQKVAWREEQHKADNDHSRAVKAWEKMADPSLPYPEKVEVPKPPLCDIIVYDLSMNSLLSGTKYRGEFEERLQKVMDICKTNPNIVLFIDEIHQMNEIGNSDGATSMGQILKPALARAEVRVIGATTTEESSIVKKDKALARRFSDVAIRPLTGDTAIDTAENILADYEKFHAVKVKEVTPSQILEMVNFHIGGVFPNNFIDVIDEAMSGAKFEGKTSIALPEIKAVLSRMSGNIII